MLIRMRTTAAGPTGVVLAGQLADVPADQAKALIDAGYAQAAEPAKPEPAKAKPKK